MKRAKLIITDDEKGIFEFRLTAPQRFLEMKRRKCFSGEIIFKT